MDVIADALRQLREAAIQRRDAAAAELVAIDYVLTLVENDLADLAPVTAAIPPHRPSGACAAGCHRGLPTAGRCHRATDSAQPPTTNQVAAGTPEA